MPTLVSAVPKPTPLMLPRTSELLSVTWAMAPMAVAFVGLKMGPGTTSAKVPMIVLLLPFVFDLPAAPPKKAFPEPATFPEPAPGPKKALPPPSVLLLPAPEPTKVFDAPVVFEKPALSPKKELLL